MIIYNRCWILIHFMVNKLKTKLETTENKGDRIPVQISLFMRQTVNCQLGVINNYHLESHTHKYQSQKSLVYQNKSYTQKHIVYTTQFHIIFDIEIKYAVYFLNL